MRRGVTGVLARTNRDQKPIPEPALGFRLPRHTAPGRIPARGALRPSLGTNFLAPHIAAKAPLGANGGEVRGQDGSQPEGEEGGAPQPRDEGEVQPQLHCPWVATQSTRDTGRPNTEEARLP